MQVGEGEGTDGGAQPGAGSGPDGGPKPVPVPAHDVHSHTCLTRTTRPLASLAMSKVVHVHQTFVKPGPLVLSPQ